MQKLREIKDSLSFKDKIEEIEKAYLEEDIIQFIDKILTPWFKEDDMVPCHNDPQ